MKVVGKGVSGFSRISKPVTGRTPCEKFHSRVRGFTHKDAAWNGKKSAAGESNIARGWEVEIPL
jgi:hypothetical protein